MRKQLYSEKEEAFGFYDLSVIDRGGSKNLSDKEADRRDVANLSNAQDRPHHFLFARCNNLIFVSLVSIFSLHHYSLSDICCSVYTQHTILTSTLLLL